MNRNKPIDFATINSVAEFLDDASLLTETQAQVYLLQSDRSPHQVSREIASVVLGVSEETVDAKFEEAENAVANALNGITLLQNVMNGAQNRSNIDSDLPNVIYTKQTQIERVRADTAEPETSLRTAFFGSGSFGIRRSKLQYQATWLKHQFPDYEKVYAIDVESSEIPANGFDSMSLDEIKHKFNVLGEVPVSAPTSTVVSVIDKILGESLIVSYYADPSDKTDNGTEIEIE